MAPNDWPIFELANAIVLDKHGQTMENALLVSKRGPFIVRGHLIIDDPSQNSHRTSSANALLFSQTQPALLLTLCASDYARPTVYATGDSKLGAVFHW